MNPLTSNPLEHLIRTSVAASTLPTELQTIIDQSVKKFEDQWGLMLAFAKANGYIANYRAELERVVNATLEFSKR